MSKKYKIAMTPDEAKRIGNMVIDLFEENEIHPLAMIVILETIVKAAKEPNE
jgi:AAA15 family ATPase/GTPase